MTVTIHRGTHEIGGSCVEIRTRQTKILLDLGLPLDFDSRPQEQQEQIRREALEWAQDADAIFISHYHADHHGLLPDTHRDVAIYATAGTAAMMHVTEVIHGRGDADYLRHISVLSKDADDRKFEPVIVGDICITPYTVDHAAYDACAFLIEAEGWRILYSGDIRRHGVKGFLYHNLPRKVDCLLLEGTNLATEKACMNEAEICERFKEQFRTDADKLHYVWCSGQNIDRIVQIYKAALVCSRKLIVDTYVAYVLEAVHRFKPSIPSPLSPFEGHDVFRYFCQHAQLKRFEKAGDPEIVQRLKALPTVDTTDIGHNPGKYAWLIRPSMLPYMQKYSHRPSVVVTSIWEGYEKDEPEFMNWIRERGFANPHIHTSGHADAKSLQSIVRHVDPGLLIPIHTTVPERFATLFPNRTIRCPQDNEPMEL